MRYPERVDPTAGHGGGDVTGVDHRGPPAAVDGDRGIAHHREQGLHEETDRSTESESCSAGSARRCWRAIYNASSPRHGIPKLDHAPRHRRGGRRDDRLLLR
jgi:hypothetical protein